MLNWYAETRLRPTNVLEAMLERLTDGTSPTHTYLVSIAV